LCSQSPKRRQGADRAAIGKDDDGRFSRQFVILPFAAPRIARHDRSQACHDRQYRAERRPARRAASSIYSPAKAAIIVFIESLAREVGPRGIQGQLNRTAQAEVRWKKARASSQSAWPRGDRR
jgi:NAD(P)-dependent dehydrogenase (short-subunit alcohol dehydrogenase family)